MYYRVSGKETGYTRPGDEQRARSKAALKALADEGKIERARVAEAIAKYGIETDRPAPWTV